MLKFRAAFTWGAGWGDRTGAETGGAVPHLCSASVIPSLRSMAQTLVLCVIGVPFDSRTSQERHFRLVPKEALSGRSIPTIFPLEG